MGIGFSVFLLAAGAILTFAVDALVDGVDLIAVGVILMIAGVIGLAVELLIFAPRRRDRYDSVRETRPREEHVREEYVTEEYDEGDPGAPGRRRRTTRRDTY